MSSSCHVIDLRAGVAEGCDILKTLSSLGVIDPILVFTSDADEFEVLLINHGVETKTDLMSYLSSLGKVDDISISAVIGPDMAESDVLPLTQIMDRRSDRIRTMVSGATVVREVRVFAPSFDKYSPPRGFFSEGAVNVILIPEDRASDEAIARPAEFTSDWFASHVVVELASLFGLWSGIDESPIESRAPIPGGLGDPLAHQFRSFCRIVRGPAAVGKELLPESGLLPVPAGFTPAPDPTWMARHFAQAIFPSEFRFEVEAFVDPRESATALAALQRFAKEFLRTFISLPKFLIRGFTDDLNASARLSLQRLYGEHSWVQIRPDSNDTVNEKEPLIDQDEVLQRIVAISERPSLAISSPVVWTKLVHDVLGAADGSADAAQFSQYGIEKKFLLADPNHIALPRDMGSQEIAQQILQIEETLEDDLSESDNSEPANSTSKPSNLLSFITEIFRLQVSSARETLSRSVGEVLNAGARETQVSGEMARGVIVALVSSMSVFLVTLLSTTRLHGMFSFEQLSSMSRARLWVVASLAVGYIAGLCLPPRRSRQMQTYFVGLSSAFAALLIVVLLVFRPVYRAARRALDWSGDVPVYLLTGAIIAVVIWAMARQLMRAEFRKSISFWVLGGTLYLYVMIGSVVALSRDDSIIQSMSHDSRLKLQVLFFTVSIVAILSALAVVTVVRIREHNAFHLWISRLQWNAKVAEWCASEEKLLFARLIQWLGTASAISRLIWNPLGSGSSLQSRVASESESLQLQKFKMTEVLLTPEGEEAFTARIRRLVVRPGWLTSQYERVVSQYGKELALKTGLLDGDLLSVRPETCSLPEDLASVTQGRVSSRRWEFAVEFESGMYDEVLSERAILDDQETLFSSVLSNPKMYTIESGNSGSISEFMDEAMVHTSLTLPPSAIRFAPLALTGNSAKIQSSVWWPDAVLSNAGIQSLPDNPANLVSKSSRVVGSTLFAMRADWSSVVAVSQLAGSTTAQAAQPPTSTNLAQDEGF